MKNKRLTKFLIRMTNWKKGKPLNRISKPFIIFSLASIYFAYNNLSILSVDYTWSKFLLLLLFSILSISSLLIFNSKIESHLERHSKDTLNTEYKNYPKGRQYIEAQNHLGLLDIENEDIRKIDFSFEERINKINNVFKTLISQKYTTFETHEEKEKYSREHNGDLSYLVQPNEHLYKVIENRGNHTEDTFKVCEVLLKNKHNLELLHEVLPLFSAMDKNSKLYEGTKK